MSKKKKTNEFDVNLYIFSNDPNEQGTMQILQMFYRGAFENTIGIMRAKNTTTGKIESILVGVEISPEGTKTYPLAKVYDPSDVLTLVSPDGKGGFFGDDNSSE